MKNYLQLVKISDKTKSYLLDETGQILFRDKVVDGYVDDHELVEELKGVLTSKVGGKIETKSYMIFYSPLILGNNRWLLALTVPNKEVDVFIVPIFTRIFITLIIVLISFVLYGYIINTEARKKYQSSLK